MGTARDLVEGGNEFSQRVKGGMLKKHVSKEIKGASVHAGGGSHWRGSWDKEVNGVGGTAEGKGNKGGMVTGSSKAGRGRFAHGGKSWW